VSVDADYLHDLERCARRVYELHNDLANWRTRRSIDLIFDRDRRLAIGLVGQLLASIALIPWLGASMVLAGLALLYVGALTSAAWTITRMQQARHGERLESVDQAVRRAIVTCPPLDAGARALLIRLANLTAILPTPRSVALLQATLREVSDRAELRSWPFLDDVAALVSTQNSRALLSLRSSQIP
jgi:hypothetical protein